MMFSGFDKSQWERIRSTYRRWWAHELDRPIIDARVMKADAPPASRGLPYNALVPSYDRSIPAEKIVRSWDDELARWEFLGDSYPGVWANFGAAFLAALLGAPAEATQETVWLHPHRIRDIHALKLSRDPDNVWHRRLMEFCRAAGAFWNGRVQIGMATGGIMDVLAALRSSSELLTDLYDHPEEVLRLVREAHEITWQYFDEVYEAIGPANPGYSCWARMFSEERYQILICDFCCMISPEAFGKFVLPELAAACGKLSQSFYHMDGPDAVRHLPALLSIKRLGGIQWIPGAGMRSVPLKHWSGMFRDILAAGKLAQVHLDPADLRQFDELAEELGTDRGFHIVVSDGQRGHLNEVCAFLRRHRVE